jgi:hypothetical protein
MLVNGCYKKCYNVVLEYLNINIISDNLDLENKKIYLDEKIELIPINITHLYNNITNKLTLPNLLSNKPALEYIDIINYWNNLDNSINEIKKLKLNNDYYIIPFYIINNILILGIVFYSNLEYIINTKEYKINKTSNLLCYFNNNNNNNNNKFNVIKGILNYSINLEILKKLSLENNNIPNVSWLFIFRNIINYLPKFEIIINPKCNKAINFFQNRLNP